MNRFGLVIFMLGLMFGSVALGTESVGAAADSLSSDGPKSVGRQYFERYCSSCHGSEGHGDGPIAALFRTPPADLTRIAERRGGQFPEAEIAAYIDGRADVQAHGKRDMPVWGERFSEMVGSGSLGEEVVRGNLLVLIQYLRSIQQ